MTPKLGPSLFIATTMLFLAGCADPEAHTPPPKKPGFNGQNHRVENAPPDTGGEIPPPENGTSDPPPHGRERPPQSPESAPPTSSKKETPPPAQGNPEYGKAVPGKPGFVTSPYAPYQGYVDVRGYAPGTEVKDPYTGKIFLVPAQ